MSSKNINMFPGKNYKKSIVNVDKSCDFGIKNHIYISYDHTKYIKDYILNEDWGQYNKRLFYHLNYSFRMRLMNKSVYKYEFNDNIFGVFNTCLLSKDNQLLYMIFKKNKNLENKQLWTLPNDAINVNQYMMTKDELIRRYNIYYNDIPKAPKYYNKQFYFNTNWNIYLNWDYNLKLLLNSKTGGNTKQIILGEFKRNGIKLNTFKMRQILIKPLNNAFNDTLRLYKHTKDYICPAVFFEDKGYKIVHEALLNVEYPHNSGKYTQFIAVFEEVPYKRCYNFIKLLNVEMGFKNARLVGPVPSLWKFNEITKPLKKKRREFKINVNNTVNNNCNNNNNNIERSRSNDSSNISNIINISPSTHNISNTKSSITNNYSNYHLPNLILTDVSVQSNSSALSDSVKITPTPMTNMSLVNDTSTFPDTFGDNNYNINNKMNTNCNIPLTLGDISAKSATTVNSDTPVSSCIIGSSTQYPKLYNKKGYHILALMPNQMVYEDYKEVLIEQNNPNAIPVKKQFYNFHKISDLDINIQQQLLLSDQIKTNTSCDIYQVNNNYSIEKMTEVKLFKNGSMMTNNTTSLTINGHKTQI